MLRGDDSQEEPLEGRGDDEHQEGGEKEGSRDGDLGVPDLLAHGAAGFEARKAPPDQGHHEDELPGFQGAGGQGCLEELQADPGGHGGKPDERGAPEEEHHAVLEFSGDLHAPPVDEDEQENHRPRQDPLVQGEGPPQGLEKGFQVEGKGQGFAAGHRNEGDDEIPSGQHAPKPPEAHGGEAVGPSRIGQGPLPSPRRSGRAAG